MAKTYWRSDNIQYSDVGVHKLLQVKSKPLTLYLINFVPRSENIYSDAKIYYNYIEFAIVESITFKIFFNDTG